MFVCTHNLLAAGCSGKAASASGMVNQFIQIGLSGAAGHIAAKQKAAANQVTMPACCSIVSHWLSKSAESSSKKVKSRHLKRTLIIKVCGGGWSQSAPKSVAEACAPVCLTGRMATTFRVTLH